MKPSNTQFGMRENTASSRQHDSRFAAQSAAAPSERPVATVTQELSAPSVSASHESPPRFPNNAAHTAATGEEGAAPPREHHSTQQRFNHDKTVALDLHASKRVDEYPLTVREAAKFLGVSPQTVYLWVERKQIPHLRVMGRNIRFFKSDLETFRASFRQEMENA
jgi:excisionase family DNA binding protein